MQEVKQIDRFNQIQEDEIEIDLKELGLVLLKKAWLIILVACVTGGLAFGVTEYLVTPQYEASSMIYVLSKSTSMTSLADIQLSAQLTADYTLLATSRPVVEEVIDTLGVDSTYEKFIETISVENPADTHVLKITVTNPNNVDAMNIADAMADVVSDRVANVMATEKPTIVERAVIPLEPSSPSMLKNVAIGCLVGIFLVVGILVWNYLLDDTIKDEEDVEKYLHKTVFATMPKQRVVTQRQTTNSKKQGTKGTRAVAVSQNKEVTVSEKEENSEMQGA